MKKGIKVLLVFVILVLLAGGVFIILNNNGVRMRLVIVEVEDNYLKTIEKDTDFSLYKVEVEGRDMSEFKQGQEIIAHYDGISDAMFPGRFTADKVEIVKEKSDMEIPIRVLRYFNYLQDNISVEIEKFTNTSMEISITDSNKYPLDYGDDFSYYIQKKNLSNVAHNQVLTEEFKNTINRNVVETENGTTIIPSSGENPNKDKYKSEWEELEIIGLSNYKNQIWEKTEDENLKLKGRCSWTGLYGELHEEGEYKFVLSRKTSSDDDFFRAITINFVIDENGNITYEEPEFEW